MTLSLQKKKELEVKQRLAYNLYKDGYSLREIGKQVGKSYEWVRVAIKKIEGVDNSKI